MNEHLLSFISKLNNKHLHLSTNSRKIDNYIKLIQKRLTNLPEDKARSLAIFLQHYELSIFTDQELLAVADKRLDLLISNTNETLPVYIQEESLLYDTGSSRTSLDLLSKGLSASQINFMLARASRVPSSIRRV